MRIIDKNTDFYDYLQNVYRDNSLTFDRTDSFLLTKDIMCRHLHIARSLSRFDKDELTNFVLLQICNTFWLFFVEITKVNDYMFPVDYTIELLAEWKNYNKSRRLIKLDVIKFGYPINTYDKAKNQNRISVLMQAVDTNNFFIDDSINKHSIIKGDNTRIEKHICILRLPTAASAELNGRDAVAAAGRRS